MTRLAYVLTHHPRPSQTFIDAEIDALEAAGALGAIYSVNHPEPGAIRTDQDRRRAAATTYVKAQGPGGAARALLVALRHFGALSGVTLLAVRTASRRPRAVALRLAHLVEAVVVWRSAADRGIEHLHAHFAQVPSTIAWLAAELGRRVGVGPTTWSFTVHGLGEMAVPDEHLPAPKLASATAVVCVCDATRDRLEEVARTRGVSPATIVVRCGVDLDAFAVRDADPALDPPRVLMVGRLAEAKGQRDAVAAAGRLRDRGVALHLVLVGDGPDREHLADQVRGAGLDDVVELTGERRPDEVAELLVGATVFCLPSYDEGLPVAVIEAMAVGCPVVATAIAGIPELIVDGRSGLLIAPGDVVGLADALERLLVDPALRRSVATAGRRAVEIAHDRAVVLPELLRTIGVTPTAVAP